MARKAKVRKQRVVLRRKRRDELKKNARVLLTRSAALALAAGFVLGMVVQGDSFFSRFLRAHVPAIEMKLPKSLTGLPVEAEFASHRFWFWLPGMGARAEFWLRRRFPAVRAVQFERDYQTNRIIVHIEPRTPMVRWREAGMDAEGMVFPLGPGTWSQLPLVTINTAVPKVTVSRFLNQLCQVPDFWNQVAEVRDDPRGNFIFELRSGTQVVWGEPERALARVKAGNLCRVLQDVHQHLGGTAVADLRFFDEGRIIIRPKSVRS